MADLPGAASGLLVRGYMGKEAGVLVTLIDPGVVFLVAELGPMNGGRPRNWPVEHAPRGAQAPRRIAAGDHGQCSGAGSLPKYSPPMARP